MKLNGLRNIPNTSLGHSYQDYRNASAMLNFNLLYNEKKYRKTHSEKLVEKKITKFNEENNLNSSEVNAVSPVKPVKPVGDEESDLVAIAEGLMDETEKNSMLLSDVDKIDQPVKSLLDDRTTRLLSRLKGFLNDRMTEI